MDEAGYKSYVRLDSTNCQCFKRLLLPENFQPKGFDEKGECGTEHKYYDIDVACKMVTDDLTKDLKQLTVDSFSRLEEKDMKPIG